MCEVCIKQDSCAGADYKINLIVPASIKDGDVDNTDCCGKRIGAERPCLDQSPF